MTRTAEESLVTRICIMYPDGSIGVMTGADGETAARRRAGREVRHYNKGERDKAKHAAFGSIQVSLMSFKELC